MRSPSTAKAQLGAAKVQSGGLLKELAHSLHDLCQPLTALQCRLEIEQMEREAEAAPSSDQASRIDRTIADGLRECARLNERVSNMRTLVRRALAEEQETQG